MLPEKNSKMKTTVKKNTTHPVYNEVLKVKRKKKLVMVASLVSNILINQLSVWVFSVSHRAPPVVWKETAGLRVAFRNPEKEGVSW